LPTAGADGGQNTIGTNPNFQYTPGRLSERRKLRRGSYTVLISWPTGNLKTMFTTRRR
jgi:hypothetical protein